METLLAGRRRGAAGAAADPHPPRPRRRDRRARGAVPGPRGVRARAGRAAPGRPVDGCLRAPSGIYGDEMERAVGTGRARCPERNLRVLEGGETIAVAGRELDVEYTPGHASHHVVYFDRSDGTAYVGDVAGVRIPPSDFVRPPTPPPDIDVEQWQRSIDLVAARRPARLALTHFGMVGRAAAAPRADEACACDEQAELVRAPARRSTATPESAVRARSSARCERPHARGRGRRRSRRCSRSARRSSSCGWGCAATGRKQAERAPASMMATETVEQPRVGGPGTGSGGALAGDRPERQPQHLRPRGAARSRA